MKIGILGAARITPQAILTPARAQGIEVVGIAARDRANASLFAQKYGIPKVFDRYEDLLGSPDIDAVYNPLPNSLHHKWTLAALAQGKHVLCEKPLTANAREAAEVVAAAQKFDRVAFEGFHWRYHAMTKRAEAILAEEGIGELQHVEARLCGYNLSFNDIRYRADLAGGALMDMGCYAIHVVRTLSRQEPRVVSARVKTLRPQVDRWAAAELDFGGKFSGRIECALFAFGPPQVWAHLRGSRGSLTLWNPYQPHHLFNRLIWKRDGRTQQAASIPGHSTYHEQLAAFRRLVEQGGPYAPPHDSVANMQVIDECYRQAGLTPRGQWS